MAQPVAELEGTWEEIAAQASRFQGRRVKLIVLPGDQEGKPGGPLTLLSKKLAEISEADPSAWDQVPEDLAEQHDHYVYGWPKK